MKTPQKITSNLPFGSATTVANPHTGTPCAAPISPTGSPFLSKTCQASEPPFFQPVPSVQTRMVSPRAFVAIAGCLRLTVGTGGATGFCDDELLVLKYTWLLFY